VAESVIGGGFGATLDGDQLLLSVQPCEGHGQSVFQSQKILSNLDAIVFGEGPGHIVVSIRSIDRSAWEQLCEGITCIFIGEVTLEPRLRISRSTKDNKDKTRNASYVIDLGIGELEAAWNKHLPFD
jgi:hypothetical protein